MQRKLLVVVLVVLAALIVGALPNNAAHAAPMASKGKCIVHDIHLDGNGGATWTCKKYDSGGISPQFVQEDHCGAIPNYRLEIISASSGSYCFWGVGYLGIPTISYVSTVRSLTYIDWAGFNRCGSGWVMYYPPAGGSGIK